MLGRVAECATNAGKLRRIGGKRIAAPVVVGVARFLILFKHQGQDARIRAARPIRQIELIRRAGGHADRRPRQISCAFGTACDTYQEALTIIEIDGGEIEPIGGIARMRPGGGARQHIHLPRLQGRQTRLGRQHHGAHLIRIAQDCGSNCAAGISIQPAIDALAINHTKAGCPRMRTTNQRITCANGGNRRALLNRLREGRQRGEQASGKQEFGFHVFSSRNSEFHDDIGFPRRCHRATPHSTTSAINRRCVSGSKCKKAAASPTRPMEQRKTHPMGRNKYPA